MGHGLSNMGIYIITNLQIYIEICLFSWVGRCTV